MKTDASCRRLPPYSEEAERGVLGSMLIEPERVIDLCFETGISVESFYIPAHRLLFEQLLKMRRENYIVDLLTVGEELKNGGRLEQAGGYAFLEGLIDSTPTSAHAQYYAEIVKEKHTRRLAIEIGADLIDEAYSESHPIDVAASAVTKLDKIVTETSSERTIDEVHQNIVDSWDSKGIPSHLFSMNEIFKYDGMVVLGAYPSVGKTANIVCETIAWCENGLNIAGASLEMSEEKIRERIAGSVAGVNTAKLFDDMEGRKKIINTLESIRDWKLTINDRAMTCDQFCAWARAMKARGAELIWLDYLQLFSATAEEWRMPVEQRTSMWSNKIKATQKQIEIPIVVLSQLSRPFTRDTSSMPPPPTLSSLRYSGSIEQDADAVLLMYKDPDLDPSHFIINKEWPEYIDIGKQRNGETGRIKIIFDRPLQRIRDAADIFAKEEHVEVKPRKTTDFEW